jgi:hypothetical protein
MDIYLGFLIFLEESRVRLFFLKMAGAHAWMYERDSHSIPAGAW